MGKFHETAVYTYTYEIVFPGFLTKLRYILFSGGGPEEGVVDIPVDLNHFLQFWIRRVKVGVIVEKMK